MSAPANRMPGPKLLLQWVRDGFKVLFSEGPGAVLRGMRRVYARQVGEARPAQATTTDVTPKPPMLCWLLESPDVTAPAAASATFEVRGWISSVEPVSDVHFRDPQVQRLLPIVQSPRPDVTAVYGMPTVGFSATCPYEQVADRGTLTLLFRTGAREHEIVVPTYRPSPDAAERKRAKLARIRPVLQCPACASRDFEDQPEALRCRGCGTTYPRSAERYDFLTPELRAIFNIVPTENVSSNGYDGEALNLIHRHRDGLVLDCGAGLRDRYYGNVVNYEIVPYGTTDVLGVGERLPFADASFDAVFSFAVLEHVKDPFACARELLRVLKPGGTLYCQVPFLQPVHGYPHHYYNMTLTGMRNLFGDAIQVQSEGTFLFGQPIFALSWMLNRYVEGLPPHERDAFKSLSVADLLEPGNKYLGAPFVTSLAVASREELSCCNSLIATKVAR